MISTRRVHLLGVGFAALAAIWISFILAALGAEHRAAKRAFSGEHAAGVLLTDMLDQEIGLRGYAATANPTFLGPLRVGRADLRRTAASARHTIVDPETAPWIDRQLAAAVRWWQLADEAIARTRTRGPSPAGFADPRLHAAMRRFRGANAGFERALGNRRDSELARSWQNVVIAILAASAIVALAGYLLLRFARRAERRSEARFRGLLQSTTDLITLLDAEMCVRYQSPAVERVLGYAPGELLGGRLSELLHPDDVDAFLARFRIGLAQPGVSDAPQVCRWRHRDGSYRHIEYVVNNLIAESRVGGVVLTSRDVSERIALENQLKHRAFHDALTDLANRALFEERLERTLAEPGAAPPAIVLLDLDDFKTVNDSLGHPVGDKLLMMVASRLRRCVDPSCTVARLGGDEFALLVTDATDADALASLAQDVLSALHEPVNLAGRSMPVTASLGIAVASPGATPDELLRNADIALYQAKGHGKARHKFYEPRMLTQARRRLDLEAELRQALDADELLLHYQPVFSLRSGKIVGCEALLRWNHPTRGLLTPGAFIELAQDTGLVIPIGLWGARQACRQAREWQLRYPDRPLTIGVNLSLVQLEEAFVADELAAALSVSRLEPGRVVIEVTETVMMKDVLASARALRELKALGVRLAIDDFGTGYSSLSYLKQLPFDSLKIPKPFVETATDGERGQALTAGIVALAKSLGLETIAEGVETDAQLEAMRALGCDSAQGYLLARPAEAAEIERLIDRSQAGEETAFGFELGPIGGLERPLELDA